MMIFHKIKVFYGRICVCSQTPLWNCKMKYRCVSSSAAFRCQLTGDSCWCRSSVDSFRSLFSTIRPASKSPILQFLHHHDRQHRVRPILPISFKIHPHVSFIIAIHATFKVHFANLKIESVPTLNIN